MKGSPEEPKCNVSRMAVDILKQKKIYYKGKPRGWSDIEILMRRSGEIEEDSRDHGVDTTDSAGAKVTKAGSGKVGISATTGSSQEQLQAKFS
ncbi:unnamed protein product [Prunus armeniaca]|uniref:Uncharacterized protein n=1 Tax=Prunus armeniaca TaxID=36596 RepID=A0A6J5WXI4_PRUAR|nr:unnamed protein product [Prunus armeniaca]